LIRAATAGIECGRAAGRTLRALGHHQWNRSAFEVGKVIHEIVERLERACCRILQDQFEPALGFAGEQRDAQGLGAVEIGIDAIEHTDRAGDVETADDDCNAPSTQWRSNIECTRKLVGLDPDQHHHASVRALDHARKASGANARIRFVVDVYFKFDVGAENSTFRAVLRKSIERGE